MLSKEFKHIMQTDTVATAKSLLGMQLCLDGQVLGRIVETEAYLGAKAVSYTHLTLPTN